jgi:hypothetical protein
MRDKFISITLIVYIALLIVASFALVSHSHAAASLTPPSTSMKGYEGRGFTVSLPSNWIVDTLASGMSFCAATDGKLLTRLADGTNVSILQGLAAGYRKTTSSTTKAAADQTIRAYQNDNPGLRVIRREAKQLGGFPAESVLIESATGRGGELERSWMLIAVKDSQLFLAAFTSPARDYERLQSVFMQIADSIRLTAWQKGASTSSRTRGK